MGFTFEFPVQSGDDSAPMGVQDFGLWGMLAGKSCFIPEAA